MNCVKSPSGEHEYSPNTYGRDDQGFYLDCVHCGQTQFFDCYDEDGLYSLFGDDDSDDYTNDEEE